MLEILIDDDIFRHIRPGKAELRPCHIVKGKLGHRRADLHQKMVLRHFADEPLAIVPHFQRLIGRRCNNGRGRRIHIDRSERSTPPLAFIQFAQAARKGRFSSLLHFHVQRRKNLEPALIHHRFSKLRDQQLSDILHKVGRSLFGTGATEMEYLRCRLFAFCRGEELSLFHARQYMFLSLFCAIIGLEGRIMVRRFRETSQKCGFSNRESGEILSEICLSRRGDTIGTLSKVNLI